MWMWMLLLITVFAGLCAGIVYLTIAVSRFGALQSLARGKKRWSRLFALILILAGFLIATLTLSFVNAVFMFLHVAGFFLLAALIMRILRHFTDRPFKIYLQGWIALAASVVTLSAGFYLCTHVWKTEYFLETSKAGAPVKAALFSDSHLGSTFDGAGLEKYVREIEQESVDILLIPGDFVDDASSRSDLDAACAILGQADIPYGVWIAFGNHDEGYYNDRDFSADELRSTLRENGIHLLEDEYELVDDRFYVAGRRDARHPDRKTMDELLEGADRSKYIILMDHQPNDYENEAGHADLVVSGHTHGGQVFPFNQIGVLLGSDDRSYGTETRDGTVFIVTSGISDWELYFKTGTKSEYAIIHIQSPE